MALSRFGFLVTGSGLDPERDRMTMSSGAFELTVIGMSEASRGPAAAKLLVDEGIELIELCGGFGPVWAAKVIAEIQGKIPVGSVGYGPEAIEGLQRLFAD